MSFEEDPECPWDGSLAAIPRYLLLTFRFNQSPTLTTGSSTSHLLILWELFGWHIKQIRTQKPHNEVKKYSIYLNWDYNTSQTEKINSWSKPIVRVYINEFSGPNSVYLLGVGWEAWNKKARPSVVKDHHDHQNQCIQEVQYRKELPDMHCVEEYQQRTFKRVDITGQSTITGPQWW